MYGFRSSAQNHNRYGFIIIIFYLPGSYEPGNETIFIMLPWWIALAL